MRRLASLLAFVSLATISLAVVPRASARSTIRDLDDATIVAIFDAANAFDIETGRLGARHAQNKEVRDYGTMLAQVHTDVRKKAGELAKKLGVKPTLPKDFAMAKDHAAALERLRSLRNKGAAFDRAFLEHEQAFHAAVINAVTTTLLPAIKNQELKDFVASLGPAFEAHRLQAENLQRRLVAEK